MNATCQVCERTMDPGVSCSTPTWVVEGVERPRVPYNPDYGGPDQTCHDCGTPGGGLHHPGCDMEKCPACGFQAIGCGCHWEGDEEDEPEQGEQAEGLIQSGDQ